MTEVMLLAVALLVMFCFGFVVGRTFTLHQNADKLEAFQSLLDNLKKQRPGIVMPNRPHQHVFTRYAQRTKGKWDFWDCQACGVERALPRHSSPFVRGQQKHG